MRDANALHEALRRWARRRPRRPRLGCAGHLRRGGAPARPLAPRRHGGGPARRRPSACRSSPTPSCSGAGTCSSSCPRWPRWRCRSTTTPSSTTSGRDWSPGYDGAWDVARVKESIGDPERIVGRHRLLPRHVRPLAAGARAGRRADGGAAANAEADAVPARRATTAACCSSSIGVVRSTSWPRAPRWRSSTGRATSSTSSGPTSSTGASSASSRVLTGATASPAHLSRAGGPPPSRRTSGRTPRPPAIAATRSRPGRVVGPAAGRGQPRRRNRAVAQRLDQPSPSLAVRAGERALGPRRRARSPRVGTGRRAAPRALAAQRATRAVRVASPCTPSRRGRTSSG